MCIFQHHNAGSMQRVREWTFGLTSEGLGGSSASCERENIWTYQWVFGRFICILWEIERTFGLTGRFVCILWEIERTSGLTGRFVCILWEREKTFGLTGEGLGGSSASCLCSLSSSPLSSVFNLNLCSTCNMDKALYWTIVEDRTLINVDKSKQYIIHFNFQLIKIRFYFNRSGKYKKLYVYLDFNDWQQTLLLIYYITLSVYISFYICNVVTPFDN